MQLANILSPSVACLFILLTFSGIAKVFSFDTSHLSGFPFVYHVVSVKSKNSALPWTLRVFSFLPKSFIALYFSFKSISYFELIFTQGMTSRSESIFASSVQLLQPCMLKSCLYSIELHSHLH